MKRSLNAGLAAIVAVMGVASTASALSYTRSKYGQYAYTSGSFVSIKDNGGDGKLSAVPSNRFWYAHSAAINY